MPTPKLNAEIIAAAIEGFESQKRRIDTQIGELRAMLSGSRSEGTATPEAPDTEAQSQCCRPSPYGRRPEEKMGSNKGGISRSRQRPHRNPQNQSGRSVPLAGVPFLRLRSAVGRSNEPKLRRRNQPAPRKLQHKRPLPRKLRKRLRRNRRRRLPPRQPGRPPCRKLLLSRLRTTARPNVTVGSGSANGADITAGSAHPFGQRVRFGGVPDYDVKPFAEEAARTLFNRKLRRCRIRPRLRRCARWMGFCSTRSPCLRKPRPFVAPISA